MGYLKNWIKNHKIFFSVGVLVLLFGIVFLFFYKEKSDIDYTNELIADAYFSEEEYGKIEYDTGAFMTFYLPIDGSIHLDVSFKDEKNKSDIHWYISDTNMAEIVKENDVFRLFAKKEGHITVYAVSNKNKKIKSNPIWIRIEPKGENENNE